ncbi:hypothetical protein IKG49_01530 [Candidatus Saccharibacteria bacterium]|nr:hypothetical protein [Candidatus Saccharibacteria bacterium]
MAEKNKSKFDLKKRIFGWFFAVIMSFLGLASLPLSVVYAEPIADASGSNGTTLEGTQQSSSTDGKASQFKSESALTISYKKLEQDCTDHLGSMSWLICSTTEKIAEATDWLYDRIQGVLEINPISMNEDSPIFNIWKYCQGITNIIFIIFFLVVIYSQITGYGISNYGIKQSLPKLIVAAVLINLSFLICSLAVDLSNIVGNGLRGAFMKVQEQAIVKEVVVDEEEEAPVEVVEEDYSDEEKQRRSEQTWIEMLKSASESKEEGPDYTAEQKQEYSVTAETPLGSKGRALIGGTALVAIIGTVVYESGAIWMLIPVALGGIVSVATGLITISLRQAVVTLLIMISPLAIVACILPNTESLFKRWLDLLKKMLIFYPMFSLLFGVSSLAGFAIVASAKDGFGVLLGTAVQIFPLFFSWSLMKMSGTFLADINAKMHAWAEKPLAVNKAWAQSHLENRQARIMANGLTPSAKLRQYLADRKIAREEETSEMQAAAKLRGQAYAARRKYRRNGTPSREGEEAYERQKQSLIYQMDIEMHKNNMNKGLGQLEAVRTKASVAQRERLNRLDQETVRASDDLKTELVRGAKIQYDNEYSYYNRMMNAEYAHQDDEARRMNNRLHEFHPSSADPNNLRFYNRMKNIMEGDDYGVQFAMGEAAHTFNAQRGIWRDRFQSYADLTPATQDVINMLKELTSRTDSSRNIDPIIGALRVLNMRGDTDEVARAMIEGLVGNLVNGGKIQLGTHASQALSNFLMFDVKDNDPLLRRFGKYINLETAARFNENEPEKRRQRDYVTWDEYINGGYYYNNNNNEPEWYKSKKGAIELMKGTSFSGVERTAYGVLTEGIRVGSERVGSDGRPELDFNRFVKNEQSIWESIMPNVIGDQFSYLSGSEQIVAFAKTLTGIDLKTHKFNWKGIFGEEAARNLTLEQKKEYISILHNRVRSFLSGQVPIQIAKTKSDSLEAIRAQYALLSYVQDENGDINTERLEELENNSFGDEVLGNYKDFEEQQLESIKKMFVGSFKEEALKGFVKMYKKGYQGEAKDGLVQLLDPDGLYDKYFPKEENSSGKKHKRREVVYEEDEDEDGGMPTKSGDEDFTGFRDNSDWTRAESEIEKTLLNNYNGGNSGDCKGFWNDVKKILRDNIPVIDKNMFDEFEKHYLNNNTNVSGLYEDLKHFLSRD